MEWHDTPEPLAERQEDHAQTTGQLSVYTDENWEQLEVDHRDGFSDPRPDPRTHPEYWCE